MKAERVSYTPEQVLRQWMNQIAITNLATLPLYEPEQRAGRRGSIGTQAYENMRHMTGGLLNMIEPAPGVGSMFSALPGLSEAMSTSPAYRKWMIQDSMPFMRALGERYAHKGSDPLHDSPFNHQMVTHTEDGKLRDLPQGTLRKLFSSENPQDWPHVVLTASHALARDEEDVVSIMAGFHRLISSHTEGKGKLDLLREPEEAGTQNGGKVVIAAAVDADHNAWLNGANLIERCTHIRRVPDVSATLQRQGAQDELPDDYCKYMSPAAERLGRQVLSLMVEEEGFIQLDVDRYKHIIKGGAAHLRANAPEVAAHLKLMGYSKGANVVSDAMRYVAYQMAHLPLYKSGTHTPISQEDIASVVSNLDVLAVACARHESPLTESEKALGMRRTNVVNKHDIIASPFDISGYDSHEAIDGVGHPKHRDVILQVEGPKGPESHTPHLAMGALDDVGQLVEGYLSQDTAVRTRLDEMFAGMGQVKGQPELQVDAAGLQLGDAGKATGTYRA